MARLYAFTRLQAYIEPGSMGVVTDARFIHCYWPKLDRPTRIFAAGSSGIRVLGRTPRNVWFPDDVVFEEMVPDAEYQAELAVMALRRGALINLTDAEAQIWLDAYEAEIAKLPPTATRTMTQRNTNFLRHRELVSAIEAKPRFEEYVAELTPKEAVDLVDGKIKETDLRDAKQFRSLEDQTKRRTLAQIVAARPR